MVLIDALSRKILRKLSENSRVSMSAIARELKVSPETVKRRLARLEEEFGIRYVLELDERELGLVSTYLIKVKFKKRPDEALLARLLRKYKEPQFAAITKGDFDLFIYATSETPSNFSRWANWFRQQLSEYIEDWCILNVIGNWIGFFSLNEGILDGIMLEGPKKAMLKLLNSNARISLKELASKMGMSVSTTQYHLKQILKSKYVKRCTIVMTKPPKKIHYFGFLKYNITDDFLRGDMSARQLILQEDKLAAMNLLIMALNLSGVIDDFLLMSFDDMEHFHKTIKSLEKRFGATLQEHAYAIGITNLVGGMPFRNLDVRKEYKIDWNIYEYMER